MVIRVLCVFMENLIAPFSLQGSHVASALGPDTSSSDDCRALHRLVRRARVHRRGALNRREIDLAGDVQTARQAAEVLTEGTGWPIAFAQTPIEQVRQYNEDTR